MNTKIQGDFQICISVPLSYVYVFVFLIQCIVALSIVQSTSSVIRQKANLKTGVSRKQSTPNFPKNEHFLPSDTHTYKCVSGGKNVRFFGKFDVLCFLETPVLKFAFLPYYRLLEAKVTLGLIVGGRSRELPPQFLIEFRNISVNTEMSFLQLHSFFIKTSQFYLRLAVLDFFFFFSFLRLKCS